MRVRLVSTLLALALSGSACTHKVQPGYVWNLWGTVTEFSQSDLSVRHKTGRIVKLRLDDATVFTNEHHPASRAALALAARVSVDVELLADGSERARVVRIVWGGVPQTPSR